LAPDFPVTESGGLLAPDFDMDWTTCRKLFGLVQTHRPGPRSARWGDGAGVLATPGIRTEALRGNPAAAAAISGCRRRRRKSATTLLLGGMKCGAASAARMARVASATMADMKPGASEPKGGPAQGGRIGIARNAVPRQKKKATSESATSETQRTSGSIAGVSPMTTSLVNAQPVPGRTGHGARCATTAIAARNSLNEEMQLATWRAAASRLFAVADPCTYVAAVAGGHVGQQASLQLPNAVIKSMQALNIKGARHTCRPPSPPLLLLSGRQFA